MSLTEIKSEAKRNAKVSEIFRLLGPSDIFIYNRLQGLHYSSIYLKIKRTIECSKMPFRPTLLKTLHRKQAKLILEPEQNRNAPTHAVQ